MRIRNNGQPCAHVSALDSDGRDWWMAWGPGCILVIYEYAYEWAVRWSVGGFYWSVDWLLGNTVSRLVCDLVDGLVVQLAALVLRD